MPNLRFISDAGHAWLEVPTVDVVASGITPSQYSYIDATNGMTYLEEDCDATKYLDATGCKLDLAVIWGGIEDHFVDGDCWVRDLPRCGPACSWCGRMVCPDRHRPQGCWSINCPDDPHPYG
jgi:hypothetical protein